MTHDFFAKNRAELCKRLTPNGFIAITAFTAMQGTNDQAAPFVQESNFWYLTGIDEADWRLIIDIDSGEEWLVAPTKSFAQQMFDGGLTAEQATATSGIKTVVDKREGAAILRRLIASKKGAHTVLPQSLRRYNIVSNPAQSRLVAQLKGVAINDVRLTLARQRAIKQPAELDVLQQAIDATIDGFEAVLPQLSGLKAEYEVDAALTAQFRRRGLIHGFAPIIAAGKNTCVLHHPLPKDPFVPNDWLLMDVGAKVSGYSADITRTIPIGQPSKRHLQVYEAVLRMHEYTFGLLRDGIPAKEYMQKAYQKVGEELLALGLIDRIKMDQTSVFKYMPHAVSHGLGVDVHDPLGRPETLQENMVITVEVGVYIPDEAIGVRLEDDVLITKDGAVNMSKRLPTRLEKLRQML